MPSISINCDLVVEVYGLDDVIEDHRLVRPIGKAAFESLVVLAASSIVEDHYSGKRPLGGRTVDGIGAADESRLHFWIERTGRVYKAVVIRLDLGHKSPPVVDNGMALVHGERHFIGKFTSFRDPETRFLSIIGVPSGLGNDQRRHPREPRWTKAIKPSVHRAASTVWNWLQALRAPWPALGTMVATLRETSAKMRYLPRWTSLRPFVQTGLRLNLRRTSDESEHLNVHPQAKPIDRPTTCIIVGHQPIGLSTDRSLAALHGIDFPAADATRQAWTETGTQPPGPIPDPWRTRSLARSQPPSVAPHPLTHAKALPSATRNTGPMQSVPRSERERQSLR